MTGFIGRLHVVARCVLVLCGIDLFKKCNAKQKSFIFQSVCCCKAWPQLRPVTILLAATKRTGSQIDRHSSLL